MIPIILASLTSHLSLLRGILSCMNDRTANGGFTLPELGSLLSVSSTISSFHHSYDDQQNAWRHHQSEHKVYAITERAESSFL